MELTTTAAVIFLLCSQIQNTGTLPVRHNSAYYQHEASGKGKQGSFVKETNENPPCQIFPVTDDPLTGADTTPIPVHKPGQDHTVPPLAPTVNTQGRDTYQKPPPPPPPPPPNVVYQPILPYYVLPPNPVGGASYVYGQGADNSRFPHSPLGAPGFFRAPQWFLDLQRDKVALIPQRSGNPTGNRRISLQAKRFDLTSSEMSSEEDSDGD